MRRGGKTKIQEVANPSYLGIAGNGSKETAARFKERETFDAKRFVTSVGAGRVSATYKAKSYIFRQGGKCEAVYYIQYGQVQLPVVSKQGKERAVGILGPGAFI